MSAEERSPRGRDGTPHERLQGAGPLSRRARDPDTTAGRRRKYIGLNYSDREYAVLAEAARVARLTPSGYVADAALTFAKNPDSPLRAWLRQALIELMAARTQVSQVRSGVMQVVDALGNPGQALEWDEALGMTRRAIQRIDEATDVLVDRLR